MGRAPFNPLPPPPPPTLILFAGTHSFYLYGHFKRGAPLGDRRSPPHGDFDGARMGPPRALPKCTMLLAIDKHWAHLEYHGVWATMDHSLTCSLNIARKKAFIAESQVIVYEMGSSESSALGRKQYPSEYRTKPQNN